MLLESITLENILSFGEKQTIELKPLNVLIGRNGSGKSNLIEAIRLLQAAPSDIARPIREGGGTIEWMWKGENADQSMTARLLVTTAFPSARTLPIAYEYSVGFYPIEGVFHIEDESIKSTEPIDSDGNYEDVKLSSLRQNSINNENIAIVTLDYEKSMLSQLHLIPDKPTIALLSKCFNQISIYSEWVSGRNSPVRQPQRSDSPRDKLSSDYSNLGLVLNKFQSIPEVKTRILQELQVLNDDIQEYVINVLDPSNIQIRLQEKGLASTIPASRLSDGVLRYLCLLAILCDPTPPPLICLEEPELGLHPDILSQLAKLLLEASERTQLIVTTHSDILIDALSEHPECVLVAEKDEDGTHIERLSADDLKPWLDKYSLGTLWIDGHIGGNRW